MIITINTIHPKLNTVRDQSSKDDISITSSLVPSLVMRYYANKNNENKCHTSKKLQTVQKPENTRRMQKSPQNAQSNVDRTNQSKMWRYSSTLDAATASRLSELRVLLRYLDCHLLIPHNINVLHTHTVQHTTVADRGFLQGGVRQLVPLECPKPFMPSLPPTLKKILWELAAR